eukprot:g18.t1
MLPQEVGRGLSHGGDIEIGSFHADENAVRHGFIRKVFGLLSLQLLLTAGITAICFAVDDVKDWLQSNGWFILVTIAASFLCLIILICVPGVKDTYPCNLMFLFIFTAFEGFLVGAVAGYYDTEAVVLAAVITVVVTVGLTIFALQTKIDFTLWSGVLLAALLTLIVIGLIAWIFPRNRGFILLYSALGAMLFSAFLIYDVQMIAGGHKYELGPDEYIEAALCVYLDILNLFLYILSLVSGGD